MIMIDGAEGEGGGQVVRNACALSLATGEPFRIVNVRGGREKPGLMRQHVTAIEAACAIGGAECEGLGVGSSEITFRPGRVVTGEHRFSIGTAGSTSLVLQAVLPPLLTAGAPSRLVLDGGTHNPMAPPFDFLARAFLPIINRMGPSVTATLVRHGFYPRGGGRIEICIEPAAPRSIDCLSRGSLRRRRATAILAGLPFDIADREIETAQKLLGWPNEEFSVCRLPETQGPGNVLLLEAEFEHVTEIVSGFGKIGVTAEAVAKTAAVRMLGYLDADAFAGPYLADQLLVPFALAGGGTFTTVKPSQHTTTAADLVERFVGKRVVLEKAASGPYHITIR
jgi:RNA 3'-terminal phosphate cyclase (ATP)